MWLLWTLLACIDPDAPTDPSDTEARVFEVPKGATAGRLGPSLVAEGLVPGEWQWKLFLRQADASCLKAGRFEVRGAMSMNELLDTILTIQGFVVGAILLVAIATLATAALVFLLSLRLRRREIETMSKIGGSRLHIGTILASEVVAVLVAGVLLAGGLTLLTSRFGAEVIRALLLS